MEGKLPSWLPSLASLACAGRYALAVILYVVYPNRYAVSSVVGLILYGICMVMAAGGRVAGQPVYTTSKTCYAVMTVSGGCVPYYVT